MTFMLKEKSRKYHKHKKMYYCIAPFLSEFLSKLVSCCGQHAILYVKAYFCLNNREYKVQQYNSYKENNTTVVFSLVAGECFVYLEDGDEQTG